MASAAAMRHAAAEEEQLLFSSLCLLDTPHAEGAKGVELGRGMFRKPNAKALELILFHTCCVVKGRAAAKKYFKGLWPLVDKDRKQSKEFYQRAQDWLKEAGQLTEHSLAQFQRNPSGSRLISFLCDLTEWALRAQHERMFPDDVVPQHDAEDSQLLLGLSEPLLTAAQAQNQLQADRLLGLCRQGSELQQQAEQAAAQLKEMFYALTAELQEAHAAAGGDVQGPQPPSLQLRSILPQQPHGGSAASQPLSVALPEPLAAQQQELEQLWQQLEQHMQEFEGLSGLVRSLSDCDVHPHAIDGQRLRLLAQLPGAPCTAGLDVAAMLEAWLVDVGAVCAYVQHLAGVTAHDAGGARAQQQRGWGAGATAGSRGAAVTPLVATSDASSHAPHLYAQLALHQNCLAHLRGLKSSVASATAAAAERIRQLEPRVYGLMAEEQQRCMEAIATEEAAAAAAAAAAEGGSCCTSRAASPPPAAAPAAAAGGTLFQGGSLQLVPPTPMLQALVHKQQQSQHGYGDQQAAGGEAHAPLPLKLDSSLARLAAVLDSPGGSSGAASASEGSDDQQHSARLPPRGVADSPCGSAGSSASSAALPAAALLMSRDLMDLDLIDEDEEADDGGVFTQHRQGVAAAATGRSTGGRRHDVGRISFARFSLGAPDLGAALAASRAAAQQEQEQVASPGAGVDAAPDLAASGQQADEENEGGGDSSFRSFDLASVRRRAPGGGGGASTAAAARACDSESGEDTPPFGWGSKAPAGGTAAPRGAAGMLLQQPSDAAAPAVAAASGSDGSEAADAAEAAAEPAAMQPPAAEAGSEDVSPLVVEPVVPHDPLAPLSLGSECLSSARPRRLTFAAAVSADSCGSSGARQQRQQRQGGPHASPGGSSSSSGGGADDAGGAGGEVQSAAPTAMDRLAAMRQRFASVMATDGTARPA